MSYIIFEFEKKFFDLTCIWLNKNIQIQFFLVQYPFRKFHTKKISLYISHIDFYFVVTCSSSIPIWNSNFWNLSQYIFR